MRTIASLADLGRVARVAEALNVSQPAISKQISEMEKLIDTPIVERNRNRLFLTPIGLRLAEHAKIVLAQIDRAAFDLEAMASGVSGSITIGSVSSVTPIVLPEAIALMKRSAPEMTISVVDGHFLSLIPELQAGRVDLLIVRMWLPIDMPEIRQKVLFEEPVVVVVGRDHPIAHSDSLTLVDLVDWPWILPSADSIARKAIEALFAQYQAPVPQNIVASTSLMLNLELMRRTETLSIFPESLAQVHAARGDLVVLPIDLQGFLSETRCFWREDQVTSNSGLALFLKCLEQSATAMNP